MKNFNFKSAIPYLTAVISFLIIASIYFYPAIEGYRLKQDDIQHHKGMAHEIKKHQEDLGEHTLWSGNMFGGMPTYQTTRPKYDGNIVPVLSDAFSLWLPPPIGVLFAYMLGFYILLLCLRINPWLAMAGAVAFAFSSYFLIILDAGHNTKATALAFLPPMIGGFILALRGKKWLGFLLIAVFLSLELYANHLQITYYSIFIILAIGIAELIGAVQNKTLIELSKRVGIILLAVLLAVLANLNLLLPTYEYSEYTTRGESELTIKPDGTVKKGDSDGLDIDYITSWSYGIDETFTLLLPNVKGGKSGSPLGSEEAIEELREENPGFFNTLVKEYQEFQHPLNSYWGDQPFVSGPVYAGAIVVFLALLAIVFIRTRLVIALTICMIFTIMLAWGKNFMPLTEFLIENLPLYNKFRAVSMILIVAEFILPLLAILFLDKLIRDKDFYRVKKKHFQYFIGGFLLLLGIFYASPEIFIDFTSQQEEQMFNQRLNSGQQNMAQVNSTRSQIIDYRIEIVREGIIYAGKFILIAIVLMLLFILGKLSRKIFILLIGAFILIDLWSVDKEYLSNEKTASGTSGKYVDWTKSIDKKMPHIANAADKQILQLELNANPELSAKINEKLNEKRSEKRRLSIEEVEDIRYSQLMRNTHYRVLNTTSRLDQDSRTAYFHKSLGGYHAAKLKRYQEVVDFQLGTEHYQLGNAFQQGGAGYLKQLLPQMNVVNMLNTKYIIGVSEGKHNVVMNTNRLGNVWFVEKVRTVPNADSAILALRNFNPANTAVVVDRDAEKYSAELSSNYKVNGNINLVSYLPNELVYKYQTSVESFAVFSEIYYEKGWNAYLNGELVDHTRVNYILRGMEIPSGSGEIIFKFEPQSYELGVILTWVSSILLVLAIGGAFYFVYIQPKEIS